MSVRTRRMEQSTTYRNRVVELRYLKPGEMAETGMVFD